MRFLEGRTLGGFRQEPTLYQRLPEEVEDITQILLREHSPGATAAQVWDEAMTLHRLRFTPSRTPAKVRMVAERLSVGRGGRHGRRYRWLHPRHRGQYHEKEPSHEFVCPLDDHHSGQDE